MAPLVALLPCSKKILTSFSLVCMFYSWLHGFLQYLKNMTVWLIGRYHSYFTLIFCLCVSNPMTLEICALLWSDYAILAGVISFDRSLWIYRTPKMINKHTYRCLNAQVIHVNKCRIYVFLSTQIHARSGFSSVRIQIRKLQLSKEVCINHKFTNLSANYKLKPTDVKFLA